jgi:hypothetical protein
VAPPGNQAATEKTNINLYHSENPVYSPKAPVKKIRENLGIMSLMLDEFGEKGER